MGASTGVVVMDSLRDVLCLADVKGSVGAAENVDVVHPGKVGFRIAGWGAERGRRSCGMETAAKMHFDSLRSLSTPFDSRGA